MADKKTVQELLIQVKRRGIKPTTKEVEALSEALNDASIYADDLNKSLQAIQVPRAMTSLMGSFDRVGDLLEYIEENTNKMSDTLGSVLEQLGENADAARADVNQLSEGIDDLNANSIAAGKAVENLGNETKTTTTQFQKAEGATNRMTNRLKDVNRQGTNSVRTFSDMARSAGGLVNTYALIAANVFALTEGFRLLNEAASVARLEEVSSAMSGQVGVSIIDVANNLREATDGAVNFETALRQATSAVAFGFDASTIEEFAVVARRAAVFLGVDMTDALNRVVRGVSKAEVELLDELGITVRLNEAFAKYAAQHNIAADSLNSFQRQQALANEVISKSEQNLGAVDDQLASTEWEKFGANVSHATNELLKFAATAGPVEGLLSAVNGVFDTFELWGRESATSLPIIDAFEKARVAPGFADDIMALNNLFEEQVRLDKELRRASRAVLTAEPGDVGVAEDTLRAVKNEYLLATKAVNKYATALGISKEEIQALVPEIQNLTTLSRSLGGEITNMINDLTPEKSPYHALGEQAAEAQKSVAALTAAGITQAEALERLKISSDQFYKLDAIREYADLQAMQTENLQEYERAVINSRKFTDDEADLKILERQLQQTRLLNSAAIEVLGVAEKTASMKHEEWTIEQKIYAVQQKKFKSQMDQIRAQSAFEYRNVSQTAYGQDSRGSSTEMALELQLEQEILALMERSSHISREEVENQRQRTLEMERQLVIEKERNSQALMGNNYGGFTSSLAELSPEMADIESQIAGAAAAWDLYGQSAKSASDLAAVSAATTASALNSVSSMLSMASQAAIGDIDAEIAAIESKGKLTEEDEKKIKELNKKKIKEQEQYAKATILIQTAAGVAYALGSAPPPLNFVNAGLVAAAGMMAYSQASNAASSQLAQLEAGSNEGSDPTSLTLGDTNDMRVDTSTAATAAERSQSLGDTGIYGRASGGNMYAGKSYVVGETGTEVVTPKTDSVISPASDEGQGSGATGRKSETHLHINALDTQSILDRADEILDALEEGANQRGQTVVKDA